MNNESSLFQHVSLIAKRINEIVKLEAENERLRRALVEIADADKCNFAVDGMNMAVRVARQALEKTNAMS